MLCWVHGEEGKGRGGIDGCEFRLVTRLLNRVGDFHCSICNQLEIPSCSTLVGSGNGLEDTCTQGPTLASRVNNHRHVIWPAPASEDTPQARTRWSSASCSKPPSLQVGLENIRHRHLPRVLLFATSHLCVAASTTGISLYSPDDSATFSTQPSPCAPEISALVALFGPVACLSAQPRHRHQPRAGLAVFRL